ncbi:hypothetical protein X777_09617 [Ooceraea biroi]|uniref:Uncharacterized protein n=1 Tax=Ooceraea biroi TaxID=2015173 RepID=A0A026W876_OOCBI|nr:hypothetical protein X777_09617 [Ooceraea biroi]
MSSKKRTKWKRINEKVRKHLLEIEDKETNNVKESITSKYSKKSLNSDLSDHCQQFNQYEFLCDSLINDTESINSNCINNESDSSCSIEYYLHEELNEERSNDNNTVECSINNNCKVLKTSVEGTNPNLTSNLAQWALKHKISHTALNSLLRTLKKYDLIAFSDARTLLQTPRNSNMLDMYDRKYCYFGIANNLRILFSKVPVLKSLQEINLFINIDGLSLANSSSIQFWLILCKINQSLCKLDPFIVAVYCGQSKPPDVNEYLKNFIQEYKNLCNVCLLIDSKLYSVSISGIICTAPARSFVKVIKGHNGFYGCERCIQKGAHPFGATIFNEIDAEIRIHESFLLQTQLAHHNGISPLTEINFPMVTKFILDPMHLVYLGVMKRILF